MVIISLTKLRSHWTWFLIYKILI
uniref:Uncharacterized protein n=1 Tax=Arundo donax TaxID=35708 RepID=A0A0A8Y653_ARUDO